MDMNDYDKTDGLVPFEKWRRDTGISRSTSWRWRCNGWVHAFRIGGKVYVNLNEVARFVELAKSGQFAKQPMVKVRLADKAVTTGGKTP